MRVELYHHLSASTVRKRYSSSEAVSGARSPKHLQSSAQRFEEHRLLMSPDVYPATPTACACATLASGRGFEAILTCALEKVYCAHVYVGG